MLQFYLSSTEYMSQRQRRIMALIGGPQVSQSFALRAYIAANPKSFLLWSLIWSVLFFSF